MAKVDSLFPSKYLKAGTDLIDPKNPRAYREVTATIDRLEMAEVGQEGDVKPILWFRKGKKALVMNKTMMEAVVDITGKDDTDDWSGERVTLYVTKERFGGRSFDVIRLRDPNEAAPEPDAEEPKAKGKTAQDAADEVFGTTPAAAGSFDPDEIPF